MPGLRSPNCFPLVLTATGLQWGLILLMLFVTVGKRVPPPHLANNTDDSAPLQASVACHVTQPIPHMSL